MLGIDPRAARATWTVILIALLCLTIYAIRNTLFIFIVSLLFAYLLLPIVDFIVRFLPWKRSRGPALVIVYILLVTKTKTYRPVSELRRKHPRIHPVIGEDKPESSFRCLRRLLDGDHLPQAGLLPPA